MLTAVLGRQEEHTKQQPPLPSALLHEEVLLAAAARLHDRALHAPSGRPARPTVFADAWLEVNGPPFQRFIRPDAELAATDAHTRPRPSGSLDGNPQNQRNQRNHSLPIGWRLLLRSVVESPDVQRIRAPRLSEFRSVEWMRRMRVLQHACESKAVSVPVSAAGARVDAEALFSAPPCRDGAQVKSVRAQLSVYLSPQLLLLLQFSSEPQQPNSEVGLLPLMSTRA